YIQHFRDNEINKYEEGMTEFELSKILNKEKRTVDSWIELYKRTADYSSRQGDGCGRVAINTEKKMNEHKMIEHTEANTI
ncbi:IS630 family transposase, partial [Francisella tularensis subsp. holarctica]|nr:IS630 family transposase [Francisella tularensis subsp. holarctica]